MKADDSFVQLSSADGFPCQTADIQGLLEWTETCSGRNGNLFLLGSRSCRDPSLVRGYTLQLRKDEHEPRSKPLACAPDLTAEEMNGILFRGRASASGSARLEVQKNEGYLSLAHLDVDVLNGDWNMSMRRIGVTGKLIIQMLKDFAAEAEPKVELGGQNGTIGASHHRHVFAPITHRTILTSVFIV